MYCIQVFFKPLGETERVRECTWRGAPERIGALIFGHVWVRTPAACVTGECFIHCDMPLGQHNTTYASVFKLKVNGMNTMKGLPRMGVPSNGTKRVMERSNLQAETAGKMNRLLRDKLPLPNLTPEPPSRSRFLQLEAATERGSAIAIESLKRPNTTLNRRKYFILAKALLGDGTAVV